MTGSPRPIFLIVLCLGSTYFGGLIAHLGYFRDEFVAPRHWLSGRSCADMVVLRQFFAEAGRSQVGIAIDFSRSGYIGALAAWAGFTLPSAVVILSRLPTLVLQRLIFGP